MRFLVASLVVLALMWPIYSADRSHARSMVISEQGIVATSHVAASQAGAEILARGGSAVDAAIAANAALAVVEPMMDGIGGDLFMIYWDAKTGKLSGLNASGWAPKRLTPEFLARAGITRMPAFGIHTATVPGAVDGWSKAHERFGKLPWDALFQPAIRIAEHGYPVPEIIHDYWLEVPAGDKQSPTADFNDEGKRVFLPGGKAPALGEVFRNAGMGRALRLIATQGRDAFYRGDIARAILTTSEKLGGVMTAEDLAEYSSEWVEPISTTYRGWRVYELPPNGQGLAALQMLNIMENFQPAPNGVRSADELHKRIEAMKLAYTDLSYVADPRFGTTPVAALLAKDRAKQRAALIDMGHANCDVPAGPHIGSDTTYLAVVDREGNIASWIQSIYTLWGSRVIVEGMGFPLQSRGASFSLDPKHANVLAGRKRPFHTIIPAFMERGDIHMGFGIMGGPNQPLAHAQFVSNVVDFGMNIQAAMEAPRFTKNSAAGCEVVLENRFPAATRDELTRRGHRIDLRKEYSTAMGRGQAVVHNSRTHVNYGASDARADGVAQPEPPR